MSLPSASLRFPRDRVLLPRTRLAYVHLRNLFTDAMRDRSARVFGYVCVWLPDEFLIFYMQEGEVVNVTASPDGQRFHPVAIADAIGVNISQAVPEMASLFAAAASSPDRHAEGQVDVGRGLQRRMLTVRIVGLIVVVVCTTAIAWAVWLSKKEAGDYAKMDEQQ